MEKRRFGPKPTMKKIPKSGKATVNFLSLPKPIISNWITGFDIDGKEDEKGKAKWEMDIELLAHPTMEVLGKMAWQTTAIVIREEIYGLVLEAGTRKPLLNELLKDLGSNNWEIQVDERGLTNLQEL
jgi:hypothetical protein|tara:strand:+ start:83 stop:463 length:381 start_codon:yes stop_codon:yes gene_type:complete